MEKDYRKIALDLAEILIGKAPETRKDVEEMLPELRESEDERIRKGLIEACKQSLIVGGFHKDKVIAWLEKQGEQKPTVIIPKFRVGDEIKTSNEESLTITKIDENGYWSEDLFICDFDESIAWNLVGKVESKFKSGDWIIHNKNTELANSLMLVNDKVSGRYLCKYRDGQCSYNIEFIDKEYRLWTIKDAKDGDVIYSRHNTESFEWIGIFKSLDKENKRVFFYGFWHNMTKTFGVCGKEAYVLYDDFSPATDEQRDLLFQKMKEAGYGWDAEKKELKKIEQKPAESRDIDWLKSIRPQWKPTEEQLGYLSKAIMTLGDEGDCKTASILNELLTNLKKLKE